MFTFEEAERSASAILNDSLSAEEIPECIQTALQTLHHLHNLHLGATPPLDGDQFLVLTGCYRVLRNSCAVFPSAQDIFGIAGGLSSLWESLTSLDFRDGPPDLQGRACVRMGLQFFGNLLVDHKANQNSVSGFIKSDCQKFARICSDTANPGACSAAYMILWNLLRDRPDMEEFLCSDDGSCIIQSIASTLHQVHDEWGEYILDRIIDNKASRWLALSNIASRPHEAHCSLALLERVCTRLEDYIEASRRNGPIEGAESVHDADNMGGEPALSNTDANNRNTYTEDSRVGEDLKPASVVTVEGPNNTNLLNDSTGAARQESDRGADFGCPEACGVESLRIGPPADRLNIISHSEEQIHAACKYGDGSAGCVDGASGCVDGASGCVDGTSGCVDGASGCVDGVSGCVDGASECAGEGGKYVDVSGCVDEASGCDDEADDHANIPEDKRVDDLKLRLRRAGNALPPVDVLRLLRRELVEGTVVFADWCDADVIQGGPHLDRLVECCSAAHQIPEKYPFLVEDLHLLTAAIELLKTVNVRGKVSGSPLSPVRKIWEHDPLKERSGLAGIRCHLIQLITGLSVENKTAQDKVGELEGIPLIMDHTAIDAQNPFITQHAIVALRILTKGNQGNQAIVKAISEQPRGLAESTLGIKTDLQTAGVKLGPDGMIQKSFDISSLTGDSKK